jgi:hypothetical protein
VSKKKKKKKEKSQAKVSILNLKMDGAEMNE